MKDRVPLYPGRVTLTPVSGQENTYDMARADQPTQIGSPLNKASLLKDATAALYGLGTDAVPDDVLNLLSRFQFGLGNEYLWEKIYVEKVVDMGEKLSNYVQSYNAVTYSNDITINSDGTFSLKNPQTSTFDELRSALIGKYFKTSEASWLSPDLIYYCTYCGNPVDGSNQQTSAKPVRVIEQITNYGYVNSHNGNAYPPPTPDGYTYNKVGQIGAACRILTGSYKGTGTYGSSNPNILTFDFTPKALILWNNGVGSSMKASMCFVAPDITQPVTVGTSGGYNMVLTWGVNFVKWYMDNNNGGAKAQFNGTDGTNYYIAIG